MEFWRDKKPLHHHLPSLGFNKLHLWFFHFLCCFIQSSSNIPCLFLNRLSFPLLAIPEICSVLIFQSYELFHYMLCQLTCNFDYVLMLSVLAFHFPSYLPEHAYISKLTLHFPFCALPHPVITTHIPFPRVRLFSRSPCSPWLPWHYFSSQAYTHNPSPGNLFSEILSKLVWSDSSFHPLKRPRKKMELRNEPDSLRKIIGVGGKL